MLHRSYTREQGHEEPENNERMEFLGDAVVQFAVSLLLYERYPRWSEGQLTRARATVVSREPLYRAAERVGLRDHMKLGRAEKRLEGRAGISILASAFEAVAAAVYLTAGMEAVFRLVRQSLSQEMDSVESAGNQTDYKTHLQESCQSAWHKTPTYRTVGETGPAHDRTFTAEALLDGEILGTGAGASKRDAEQAAARHALESRTFPRPALNVTPFTPIPSTTASPECGNGDSS